MDGQTDGPIDGWTGRWINRRMDRPTDICTYRWRDIQTEEKINLHTDKQTDRTDLWMVGDNFSNKTNKWQEISGGTKENECWPSG